MIVTTTATPLIECRGLSAGYGPLAAIRDVDLQVQAGEVVALIGRNGAGKSSTLLALSGALSPMAGEVRWMGEVTTAPLHTRCKAGLSYLTEERSIIMNMSAADNLRLGGVVSDDAVALFPELASLLKRTAGAVRALDCRALRTRTTEAEERMAGGPEAQLPIVRPGALVAKSCFANRSPSLAASQRLPPALIERTTCHPSTTASSSRTQRIT